MAYGSLPSKWNRSVSTPARPPDHGSTTTPVADFGIVPLDRRNSLDSVQQRQKPTAKRLHGLPSIKMLRERFSEFAGGGRRAQEGKVGKDGSTKSAESPKKLVKRTGNGAAHQDGKIAIPSNEPPHRIAPSASMPVLSSQGSHDSDTRYRPSPSRALDRPSLDAYLAESSSSSNPSTSQRPPRTSSISIAPRRPQTSQTLSPTSQPLPVFNRVSSDFARSAAAPPLSTLRASQYRETETLNNANVPSNRHSRILPGATLPTTFPAADPDRPRTALARSQSARTALGAGRTQGSSIRSQNSVFDSSSGSPRRRASLVTNGLLAQERNRLKDDLAYRRHSLSPVMPSATNSSSENTPTRAVEETLEDERGTTLTAGLGTGTRRTSIGLGLANLRSKGGGGEVSDRKRRTSKPFPGGFIEVPFQPTARDGQGPTGSRRALKAISIAPRKSRASPTHSSRRSPSVDEASVSRPSIKATESSQSPPTACGSPPDQRRTSAGSDDLPSFESSRQPHSVNELRTAVAVGSSSDPAGQSRSREGNQITHGAYATRLAELKALRTPTLEDTDKRNSRFETAESESTSAPGELERFGANLRRATDYDDDDESRPVSPAHFTNSPGAEHPFRLSTYLDFLPPARPSSDAGPFGTTAPLSISASSAQAVPPIVPKPDEATEKSLTLAQMEEEILKMERELALAGTPRSFFTDEGSPEAYRPSESHSVAGSPTNIDSVLTPRTARKWSIVEVEKAYGRMKRLLGSSSSSRMYTPSEAGRESQVEAVMAPSSEEIGGGTNAGTESQPEVLSTNGADEDMFSPVSRRLPLSESSPNLFPRSTSVSPIASLALKPLPVLPSASSSPPPSPTPLVGGELDTSPAARPRRTRAESDTALHRRLVLPSRVRTKVSIDEFRPKEEEDSECAEVATSRSGGPVSPSRGGGRRSRLEEPGLLRSGAGRDIMRKALGDLRTNDRQLVSPGAVPRRRESGKVSESSSWFPSTPREGGSRGNGASGDSLVSDQEQSHPPSDYDSESASTSTARPELSEIRKLDKLQIFFRYTAVKTELAKAEIERDALLDALRETRETLADVRKQRDTYEAELKQEKLFTLEVKKHLGDEQGLYVDRLENLLASRAAWQARAQEALDELGRSKLANAPSRTAPSTSPPGSPTLTIEHGTTATTAIARRPSLDRTSTWQRRAISTHSTASSAIAFDGLVSLDHGSPLLSQSIQFLSKSSDDTFSHSPTKSLAPSRVPFPVYPVLSERKASTATTESAFATCTSEEGEHSFDSTSSLPEDTKGLRKQDQAFLEELTH